MGRKNIVLREEQQSDWLVTSAISNSYITSMRDVSGLNCDARGHVAPEGGAI